jgi:hypothetical protein
VGLRALTLSFAVGGWRLAVGGWRLAVGGLAVCEPLPANR